VIKVKKVAMGYQEETVNLEYLDLKVTEVAPAATAFLD